MKRAFHFLAAALVLVPLLMTASAKRAESTILIKKFGTTAAASSPSVEIVGSTVGVFNTKTSATLTFTTDGNTSMVVAFPEFRRNAGQTVTQMTLDGVSLTLSTAPTAYSFYAGIYYLLAPTPGSHNLTVVLSAATDSLGLTALGISGSNHAPTDVGFNGTQSVTTSSTTAITATAGDIIVSWMVKQDTTTSQPILNTSGAILQNSWPNPASVGNGGASSWNKLGTLVCVTGSNRINFSWTTAANCSNPWVRLVP